MRLYETIEAIDQIFEQYEDGEIPEEANALLEALEGDADQKLGWFWAAIKNNEAEAGALSEEAARLHKLASSRKRRAESLKNYVAAAIGEQNKWKSPDGTRQFGWRRSEAVEVTDEAAIPDAYCCFERKPQLSEIKKDREPLLAGEIPGAKLVTRYNLQVK